MIQLFALLALRILDHCINIVLQTLHVHVCIKSIIFKTHGFPF